MERGWRQKGSKDGAVGNMDTSMHMDRAVMVGVWADQAEQDGVRHST